jgi:hypothetical protein
LVDALGSGPSARKGVEVQVLFCVSMTQGDFGHPEIFIIRRGLETQSSSNRRGMVAAIAWPWPENVEGKSARSDGNTWTVWKR